MRGQELMLCQHEVVGVTHRPLMVIAKTSPRLSRVEMFLSSVGYQCSHDADDDNLARAIHSSRRTLYSLQHILNHRLRIQIAQEISGRSQAGPVLSAAFSTRGRHDDSMGVNLLGRQRHK